MEPKVLIFDEITSQIDSMGRQKIKELIISLKNEGKTIIIVEHGHANSDLADEIYEIRSNRKDVVLQRLVKEREISNHEQ
jgi:energy-coupling factor transporter ATP-binding protein EcfA2